MSSAQQALEKLQRVFSVKEAEIDSIIARSEQHFKHREDLGCDLADFVDQLLRVDVSTPNQRATACESEHSETGRRREEMTEKLTCVMADVKSKCIDM
ncbi:hypothetical protein MRX96_059238 [Rhipicephalus microplus]